MHDLFDQNDVQRIIKTPISPTYTDAWYWRGDLKGVYSVKQGYHIQAQHFAVQEPGLLWETDVGVQGNSFAAIVENFLGMAGHDMAIRMAATYWTIWIARNEALWNTKVWQTAELKHMVESLINSWKLAYSNTANQNFSKMHAISVPWQPPPVGKVKCNVDAALFEDVMGFGAVVRDHNGKFVAAYGGMSIVDGENRRTTGYGALQVLQVARVSLNDSGHRGGLGSDCRMKGRRGVRKRSSNTRSLGQDNTWFSKSFYF
nr:uncharacterized protein LOC109152773 [Ipomoea batatas]